MKCLLAVCAAFFLASCSNDDDLQYSPQHGDIVGLNIKDAKYIYTTGGNARSSSMEYRQIKKDGRDMELSWIDNKGDTIKISDNPEIWNINKKYMMINTGRPINYKPSYDEDGNRLPDIMTEGGFSYLIDKTTGAIYDLGGVGLNGESAVTDNKGNIYVEEYRVNSRIRGKLYKIHTQDVTNLRLEMYAEALSSAPYIVNNKGMCFYDYRYIRPSYGTQQFIISNFIPETIYGNAFASRDNEDLYLTATSWWENENQLMVCKVSEKPEIQGEIIAHTPCYHSSEHEPIQTKWNERRNTMLINIGGDTYEYMLADKSLSQLSVDLSGFFTKNYSTYVTTDALYARKSVDKLDIIALEDYSTKVLDLSGKGIDFRSIYTMDGSDLLYFAGFQYSTSQSVIGTIDIDGNVEITESTPNPITNIIQIN